MTGFDIVVLLLVGVSAVTGFYRGFVQEILALAAWVFAVIAIYYLHLPLYRALQPYIGSTSGATVLAFAVLLLIPYAVVKAVANWAGQASRASFMGPIDRVLGLGFGGIKGLIVAVLAFSVLVLGFDMTWGVGGRPNWITQAHTYRFINASSEKLLKVLAERRSEARAAETARIREEDGAKASRR